MDNKERCRAGLDPAARRTMWLAMAVRWRTGVADHTAHDERAVRQMRVGTSRATYCAALQAVFGGLTPAPQQLYRVPRLGASSTSDTPDVSLQAANRIVCVLAQFHSLVYAPQIPLLIKLMLNFLPEDDTFAAIDALLSGSAANDGAVLCLSYATVRAMTMTLLDLACVYFPRLAGHIKADPTRQAALLRCFTSWLLTFFSSSLPETSVHHVVDTWLSEGAKVYYRFGLAILRQKKRALKACATTVEFDAVLTKKETAHNASIFAAAFRSVRGLQRRAIRTHYARHRHGVNADHALAGGAELHTYLDGVHHGHPHAHDSHSQGDAWFNNRVVGLPSRLMQHAVCCNAAPVEVTAVTAAHGAAHPHHHHHHHHQHHPSGATFHCIDGFGDGAPAVSELAQHRKRAVEKLLGPNEWLASSFDAPPRTTGATDSMSPALSTATAASLAVCPSLAALVDALPSSVRHADLAMQYSSDAHGWGLSTMLGRVKSCAPVLLYVLIDVHRGNIDLHGVSDGMVAAGTATRLHNAPPAPPNAIEAPGTLAIAILMTRGLTAVGERWTGSKHDFVMQLWPQVGGLQEPAPGVTAAWRRTPAQTALMNTGRLHLCGGTASIAAATRVSDGSVIHARDDATPAGTAIHASRVGISLAADLQAMQIDAVFLAAFRASHIESTTAATLGAVPDDPLSFPVVCVEAYGFSVNGASTQPVCLPILWSVWVTTRRLVPSLPCVRAPQSCRFCPH